MLVPVGRTTPASRRPPPAKNAAQRPHGQGLAPVHPSPGRKTRLVSLRLGARLVVVLKGEACRRGEGRLFTAGGVKRRRRRSQRLNPPSRASRLVVRVEAARPPREPTCTIPLGYRIQCGCSPVGGAVVASEVKEYANVRAGVRRCAVYSEHRVNTRSCDPTCVRLSTAEYS